MNGDVQLILVSNRGPATFEYDEDGGLHAQRGGGSFDCEVEGTHYRIRLVESDADAYDQFYNVIANPLLWFIQHYLWDLSNAPDIRRQEVAAYELGYRAVNEDLAHAVLDEVESDDAVVLLHFIHIPWTQPDAWRVLPTDIREDIYESLLANDIIGFHTRAYRRNFLLCCRELFALDVDDEAG